MGSLRRYSRRLIGRQARFNLAVLITIVVVTYLLVPWIANLVDAGRDYSPIYYEPKDFTRQEYILRHGLPAPTITPGRMIVNVVLVLLVVAVWMSLVPSGRARRR